MHNIIYTLYITYNLRFCTTFLAFEIHILMPSGTAGFAMWLKD